MTLQTPTKIWKRHQTCLRSDTQRGGNLRNLETTTIKRFDSLIKYCDTFPGTSQFHGVKETS